MTQGTVRGVVRRRDGSPVAAARVIAAEPRLRSRRQLGEPAVTDATGRYEIHYPVDQSGVDISIGVGDVWSRVRFHAAIHEVIDLILDAESESESESEFERVLAAVSPMLDGAQLSDVDDELTLLAGKAGQPIDRVSAIVNAHRLAAQLGVDPEPVYGLLRSGAPANRAGLMAMAHDDRQEAMRSAVQRRVVGPSSASAPAVAVPMDGALADVVGEVLPHAQDRAAFLRHYGEALGAGAGGFWENVAREPRFRGVSADLRRAAEFTAITGGHAPLAKALLALRFDGRPASLEDLARFDLPQWRSLIKAQKPPVPESIPGDRMPARLELYARTLERLIRDLIPTRVMAWRAATDRTEDESLRRFWHNVIAAPSTVELRASHVDDVLAAHPTLLDGIDEVASVRQELGRRQRLMSLTTAHHEVKALRAAGIGSAADIVGLGRDKGIALLKTVLDEPRRGPGVFDRAEQISGMSAAFVGAISPQFHQTPVTYVAPPTPSSIPTIARLFGPQDMCACADCASVTSPAAYLVEMLAFLRDREALNHLLTRRPDLAGIELTCPNTNIVIPSIDLVNEVLEEVVAPFEGFTLPPGQASTLDSRMISDAMREAFAHHGAKLSDDHFVIVAEPGKQWLLTDHSVLYELKLGKRSSVAVVGRVFQTKASAAQTAAEPEHRNRAAYDLIAAQSFPWSVPLDLWREEVNVYLMHAAVSRADLMRDFGGRDVPATVAEALGLSTRDHELISARHRHDPWDLWGLAETGNPVEVYSAAHWQTPKLERLDWTAALSHVPVLCRQAQLSYDELVRVLSTRYVNPGDRVRIVSPNPNDQATCEVAKLVLRAPAKAVRPLARDGYEELLDRLQRFVRLLKRLAWTIEELDGAITAVGGGLDAGALRRLANLSRLRRRTGLSTVDCAVLWHPIDTVGPDSLYQRLLQNPAVASPADPAFALTNGALTATLSHDGGALLAAFGVAAAELAALTVGMPDALTVASLSAIYRRVVLARALPLSIVDLLAVEAMCGLDPFADADHTMSFVELVDGISASGLSVAEVDYLLNHGSVDRVGWALSDVDSTLILTGLRAELQGIRETTAPRPDPSGELTRGTLAALGWPPELIAEIAAMLSASTLHPAWVADKLRTAVWPTFESTPIQHDPVIIPEPLNRRAYVSVAGPGQIAVKFVGVMSDADHVALQALSADQAWRDAVDGLFAAPASYVPPSQDALYTSATAMELVDLSVPDRFGTVLSRLLDYLRDKESIACVVRRVSVALDVTEPAAFTLLSRVPAVGAVDTALAVLRDELFATSNPAVVPTVTAFPAQVHTLTRLVKAAHLAAALGRVDEVVELLAIWGPAVTAKPVPWLDATTPTVGWLSFADLVTEPTAPSVTRFAAWRRLAEVGKLARMLPHGVASLRDALALTHSGGDASALVALLYPESPAIFDIPDAQDLSDEIGLSHVVDLVRWAKRLGATVATMAGLAVATVGEAEAHTAKQLVKARYTVDEWLHAAPPLRDQLRIKQRDALVAYLTTHAVRGRRWQDTNALYEDLLIDVEVDPCVTTSRIKQAIGSVQQFAQRCLLNLENDVKPDDGWRPWPTTLAHYRIWEAERKIFLYPENWLEPELRDDRTPFFTEAEAELNQVELTADAAMDVFANYLSKLDTVHRLEIAGKTQEGFDESRLHVIARTRGTAPSYYYRRREDGRWTGWEKVDLDISERQVAPVFWRGRLYLFWPTFVETAPHPSGIEVSDLPAKYYDVQIAFSEYRHGAWLPKRTVAQRLSFKDIPYGYRQDAADGGKGQFRLHATIERQGSLLIWFEIDPDAGADGSAPALRLTGLDTHALLDTYAELAQTPTTSRLDGMEFVQGLESDSVWLTSDLRGEGSAVALRQTPADFDTFQGEGGLYRLLYGHYDALRIWSLSYADDTRTYWIDPRLQWVDDAPQEPEPTGHGVKIHLDPSRYYQFDPGRLGALTPPTRFGDFDPSPIEQYRLETDAVNLAVTPAVLAPPILRVRSARLSTLPEVGSSLVFGTLARRYRFRTFWHPLVPDFSEALVSGGLDQLLSRQTQSLEVDAPSFVDRYSPTSLVDQSEAGLPKLDVDFAYEGGFSVYNWELFFHLPLLIATRLQRNQRFEEAHRWYGYIFDPADTSDLRDDQRFWRTKPLHDNKKHVSESIADLIARLAQGDGDETLSAQVRAWRNNPLNPHAIARLRLAAYQKNVVMRYLDNLIAWGDQLFARDTIESINEATQLYVLAAQVLGERPQLIEPRSEPQTRTFSSLHTSFGDLSDPMVEVEYLFANTRPDSVVTRPGRAPLPRVSTLYFGIQPNDKLLGYWDTVADRLFKIRHCQNLAGVVRSLPLFEPPIDPGLLVRAAAAGVDIGAILTDAAAPEPNYRFSLLVTRANELCTEVRSLGAALLGTLEKRDAEGLALLRSGNELELLKLMEQVRKQRVDEADKQIEVLTKARESACTRWLHYQFLLGQTPKLPAEGDPVPQLPEPDLAFADTAGIQLLKGERQELDKLSKAYFLQIFSGALATGAAIAHIFPTIELAEKPVGVGTAQKWGGPNIGYAITAGATALQTAATALNNEAARAARMSQLSLRHSDWVLQNNVAAHEITSIDAQLAAARVRKTIATTELTNHQRQMEQAAAVRDFLTSKFTHVELYDWMTAQISQVYFAAYKLAYDVAKRAERAYRHELGLADSTFVQYGYWDSLKKGLLSGEALFQDLKRMEADYLERNRREYELTKRVSLSLVDPGALLALRTTGSCRFIVDEALFDVDCPGHYFRRLKTVSVSIPCVAGPYTSVNATLTLESSRIRVSPTLLGGKYRRDPDRADARWRDLTGGVQSMVTSGGHEDSGLFEVNLRDERYLPFEGQGAISTWTLRLPGDFRQFDYDSIADVIMNLRYTAREGGRELGMRAVEELPERLAELPTGDGRQGLFRMFSARHDFPDAWQAWLSDDGDARVLRLPVTADRFPFLYQNRVTAIDKARIILAVREGRNAARTTYATLACALTATVDPPAMSKQFTADPMLGGAPGLSFDVSAKADTTWTITVNRADVERLDPSLLRTGKLNPAVIRDLYLVVHYGLGNQQ